MPSADSGAVVMGTGIVSMALFLDGAHVVARVVLAITAAIWLVLAAVLVGRLVADRERCLIEARSPASLTGVAGTAVLGTGLTEIGWVAAAAVLLAMASLSWIVLMPVVLRHARGRAAGVAFMVTVATEGLAALAAELAEPDRGGWLVGVAIALALAGLALYPLVLIRFDLGQLRFGRGDHWVAGGSLAISALALAEILVAARRTGVAGSLDSALRDSALVVWVAAVAWIPPLVLSELRWPRLRYDTRRWATVFPLGMYAACSFAVGDAAGVGGIADFARVWVWLAVVAWALAFAAMLRSIARTAPRATRRRPAARRSQAAGSTTPQRSCRQRAP